MKCLIISDRSVAKQTTLYSLYKRLYPEDTVHIYKMTEPISSVSDEKLNLDTNFKPILTPDLRKESELKDKVLGMDCVYVATEDTPIGEMIAYESEKVVHSHNPNIKFVRLRLKSLTNSALKKALLKNEGIDKSKVTAYLFQIAVYHILNVKIRELLNQYRLPVISFSDSLVLYALCSSEAHIREHNETRRLRMFVYLKNGLVLKTSGCDKKADAQKVKSRVLEAIKSGKPQIRKHLYIEPAPFPLTIVDILDRWNPPGISMVSKFGMLFSLYLNGYITSPFSGPKVLPENYSNILRQHKIWNKYPIGDGQRKPREQCSAPIIVPVSLKRPDLSGMSQDTKDLYEFIYRHTLATQGKPALYNEYCINYADAMTIVRRLKDPGYLNITKYEKSDLSKNFEVARIEYKIEYVNIRRHTENDLMLCFINNNEGHQIAQRVIQSIGSLESKNHLSISTKTGNLYVSNQSELLVRILSDSFPSFFYLGHFLQIHSLTESIANRKISAQDIKSYLNALVNTDPIKPKWLNGKWSCPQCTKPTRIGVEKGRVVFKCGEGHIYGAYITQDSVEPKNIYRKWRYCSECAKYVQATVKVMNTPGVKLATCSKCGAQFEY